MRVERLMELLRYDASTGVFVWRVNRGRTAKAGDAAGCVTRRRYIEIMVDGRSYQAHRLAWLYVHGAWPRYDLDHRNGNRADNRLTNLREDQFGQNPQNQRMPSRNNKSGYLGVSWNKGDRKWRAEISANGRNIFIGNFQDPALAHAEYLSAKRRLHAFGTL